MKLWIKPIPRPIRFYDLRHTHAIHVLLRWYRAGVDVQALLDQVLHQVEIGRSGTVDIAGRIAAAVDRIHELQRSLLVHPVRHRLDLAIVQTIELFDHESRYVLDVFTAFAQGRQGDRHNV